MFVISADGKSFAGKEVRESRLFLELLRGLFLYFRWLWSWTDVGRDVKRTWCDVMIATLGMGIVELKNRIRAKKFILELVLELIKTRECDFDILRIVFNTKNIVLFFIILIDIKKRWLRRKKSIQYLISQYFYIQHVILFFISIGMMKNYHFSLTIHFSYLKITYFHAFLNLKTFSTRRTLESFDTCSLKLWFTVKNSSLSLFRKKRKETSGYFNRARRPVVKKSRNVQWRPSDLVCSVGRKEMQVAVGAKYRESRITSLHRRSP